MGNLEDFVQAPPGTAEAVGSEGDGHYHYHVLALDGVISVDVEGGVRFHEATGFGDGDAETLARTIQFRVLRWFARRGPLDASAAVDMRTWQGTGSFSIDGLVRIEAEDRVGLALLDRLTRLVPPPPIHGHRYYGVMASNARLRATVVSCGGWMRIVSLITLPSTVQDNLLHLHQPHRTPRVSTARTPPQAERGFDPSAPHDWAL